MAGSFERTGQRETQTTGNAMGNDRAQKNPGFDSGALWKSAGFLERNFFRHRYAVLVAQVPIDFHQQCAPVRMAHPT